MNEDRFQFGDVLNAVGAENPKDIFCIGVYENNRTFPRH